jgi:hypothetical protein
MILWVILGGTNCEGYGPYGLKCNPVDKDGQMGKAETDGHLSPNADTPGLLCVGLHSIGGLEGLTVWVT